MEDVQDTTVADDVQFNKKLTLYVVDGGPSMFKEPCSKNCPFRKALKVVYHQIINISCSGSFSHLVGVVITNTELSKNRFNQRFSYELIELSAPSKEDLYSLKMLLDSENILEAFCSRFGGHAEVNLANLIWSCKKLMAMAGTSSRHHIIMYLSNDPNPFRNDEKSYIRVKTILDDFCKQSYLDKKGIRRINRTPGEFHVLLMSDKVDEEDEERWKSVSNSFYVGDVDELDLQAYKRTYTQRAFSKLLLEVGPNIRLGVSVFTLAREATLQKKTVLDSSTEAPLDSRTTYVQKKQSTVSFETNVMEENKKLHKAVKIGGKIIFVEEEEMRQLTDFSAKGINLLGFKSVDELDIFGDHLSIPQFIVPNEDDVRGSTQLFRALHERCFKRRMAAICRFQSRNNQKIRLIALIAERKEEQEFISNDYKNNGFYVIYLPYAEDVRHFGKKCECPVGHQRPTPTEKDMQAIGKLIRNLKKPYAPETFANPRIRSFFSMITEAAIGEKISVIDTLEPYYTTRTEEFTKKLVTPIAQHFDWSELTEPSETVAKKPKYTHSNDDLDTEQLIRSGKFDNVKVVDLKNFMMVHMPHQNRNLKKADLVEKISEYLKKT